MYSWQSLIYAAAAAATVLKLAAASSSLLGFLGLWSFFRAVGSSHFLLPASFYRLKGRRLVPH